MPVKYNNENSGEFHEVHEKQNSSVAQPPTYHDISHKIVKKSKLESQVNPRLMPKQRRITAWSSSSSLSSLTTDSLFSLTDYSSASMKYKTTGTLFGNLDLVPSDPKIDPEPYACYNCWNFDHKYHNCPDLKISSYCRNCGRRGVVMKECPRCARAYMDYMDQSYKHCNVFVSKMEVEKPVDEVQLNIIEEKYHESWDDFVENDHESPQVGFSDSWEKRETGYQHDDWDNYQSPRVNLIKKSSKSYALNAAMAEVAKYKDDDSWSDYEVVNYSYSWGDYSYKTKGGNFIDPEERVNKIEDWDYFGQDAIKEFSQNCDKNNQLKSFTTSENERVEYYNREAYKNGSIANNNKMENLIMDNESKGVSESKCKESTTGMCKAVNLISDIKASCIDQNIWSDQNKKVLEKSGRSFILEIKDQNFNILQNMNIQDEKEDWSDSEAYQSLQASFCEESETGNQMTALNGRVDDEEYWTDFDDDYESLQASFAEEYKSLDNTIEDENDCTNTFETDVLNSKENLEFHDGFFLNKNSESNGSFSFIKSEKVDDLFAPKLNSLTSSVASQSDEAYLSNNEDVEDYEYMIVDENERPESLPVVGQAVQEFLTLLDTLKHLPIQTQNIAVLHFISKQKEQSWPSQMQKTT